jgi:hypothetical protein
MFVQDFMIIDRPCGALVAMLERDAEALFRDALGEAKVGLDLLRVKVGPERWPALLAKTVDIKLGAPRRHGDVTLLPFTWKATGSGSLFPALDADLEASPLGPGRSELALRGRYEPPGGILGRTIDQFLLHRLADATVRAFLSSLANRLAVSTASV